MLKKPTELRSGLASRPIQTRNGRPSMVDSGAYTYIGKGVYGIPDAARITKVGAARIRRWIDGYRREGSARPAVLQRQHEPIGDRLALGFLDLVEVRLANAFLHAGVKWRAMWQLHNVAREMVGHAHPLATGRFRTDGHRVFEALANGALQAEPSEVMDILSRQMHFAKVVTPYFKDLDLDTESANGATRWWPLGKDRSVVIDPMRCFGQAVVDAEGVPTLVLAQAMKVERSISRVARWYAVSDESVRDAVAWESQLAHAA